MIILWVDLKSLVWYFAFKLYELKTRITLECKKLLAELIEKSYHSVRKKTRVCWSLKGRSKNCLMDYLFWYHTILFFIFVKYIFVRSGKSSFNLTLIDKLDKSIPKYWLFVPFSKLCDFDTSSSKCHIMGYNCHRNPKLGLIESYGNTK